ncbi:MAG TPA: IPTL-CTERM sorting domain-containing protein, partial [Casimicrobiaceae bacterium]
KVASGATVPGGSIIYTIVVANAGPSAAANVALSDALPADTTFTSITSQPGWTTTTPAVGSSGTITASNASLASGASASFTITAAVSGSAATGSTISNTASVSSTTADANAANNVATASTSVTGGGQPGEAAVPIPALSDFALVLLVLSLALLALRAKRRR